MTIGSLYVDEEPIYLSLTHVKFQDGVSRWLIAKSTERTYCVSRTGWKKLSEAINKAMFSV